MASPIIAAEFALAGGSHGVAFPAATLYRHIGEREDLDDVVSGNNGSGCGGSTECQAAAGYDGPTGVGSPVGLGAFSDEGSASRPPTLTGLTPSSGITGSKVIIEGTELGEAEEVQLDSLAAKFKVLSSTRIEATVPNGARVGKATVTTPAGSVIGRQRFTPTLSITAFGPSSGPPGKVVKVRGVGFTSSSTVSFAGIQAKNVTFVSSKELLAWSSRVSRDRPDHRHQLGGTGGNREQRRRLHALTPYPGAAANASAVGLGGDHREDDVVAGEAQIGMQFDGAPVERGHGRVGERDEVALGGVEHVGDAAAIAVAGERQQALDAVALGLDPDALGAVVHSRGLLLEGRLDAAHVPIIGPRARTGRLPPDYLLTV